MELSEHEQRILQQIEQQFHEHDPALAGELESTSLYTHTLSRMKWAVATFLLGVAVLVGALATVATFWIAFGGFLIMLVSALWFERNLRKLGKAGWEQATRSLRSSGLREQLDQRRDRIRQRFQRPE